MWLSALVNIFAMCLSMLSYFGGTAAHGGSIRKKLAMRCSAASGIVSGAAVPCHQRRLPGKLKLRTNGNAVDASANKSALPSLCIADKFLRHAACLVRSFCM